MERRPGPLSHVLPTRLSPAALNRYRSCAKSFWLADVERVPRTEEPSPVLVQANALHAALDLFHGLPVEDRSLKTLHQVLRSVWANHRRPGAFVSREEEATYGLAALDILTTYWESFDCSVVPLAREQWLTARQPSGIQLYGKIDRIDRTESGALAIVDYKTSRRPIDPDDLPGGPAAQVYAVLAETALKAEVERVSFIYLPVGVEVRWSPEREDIASTADKLDQLIERICADTTFDANPCEHCRFCAYQLQCQERQQVSLTQLQVPDDIAF